MMQFDVSRRRSGSIAVPARLGQQGRRARAAEVEPRQADITALEKHGTNRQRGSVH
jgi:hypothetical protein